MKKIDLIFLGITAMSGLMPSGSYAAENQRQRWQHSVEVGAGLNTIVPYASLRYHQPLAPQWVATGALQMGPAFTKTNHLVPNPLATLGLKYCFVESGLFQPFLGADIGAAWVPDRVQPDGMGELGLFGLVGAGVDIMFSPKWGLSLSLRSNLNLLNASLMSGTLTLRPEINSVWRF